MDYKKICKLQLEYIKGLKDRTLKPADKVRYGRALIANYKKAKQILKSRVVVEGDWEQVLEVSNTGLENLVESLEFDLYQCTDISTSVHIAYIDLLNAIQYLDYEDEVIYKEVQGGLEDEIDIGMFDDY